MIISEVRITLRNEPKLKAYASITFDGCFVVRGLRVIQGSQGFFVSMPSKRLKFGGYLDIAHPITNFMRKEIEEKVLDSYERELNRAEKSFPQSLGLDDDGCLLEGDAESLQ